MLRLKSQFENFPKKHNLSDLNALFELKDNAYPQP